MRRPASVCKSTHELYTSSDLILDKESLSTEFTPGISDWLPGNDLHFGQEDTGDSDEDQGSDTPVSVKKLYYSTSYGYGDEQKAILWYDNEVHELKLPDGIQYPMASGVVKDSSSKADCIELAAGEAERGRFYFG